MLNPVVKRHSPTTESSDKIQHLDWTFSGRLFLDPSEQLKKKQKNIQNEQ